MAGDATPRPQTAADVVDLVADAVRGGRRLEIRGGGSKQAVGATREATILDTSALSGVIDYDPAELVLTARAGTPLAHIEALVASEGQMLAFEPFDHGPLFGQPAGAATIGGVVAAGVAGSRRLSAGSARDHLLGFEAVSGRAERFVAGAKVVKNVTGYDLPKLAAASWGRLFVLAEVTLKVLPRGQERATVAVEGLGPVQAQQAMARAMGSQADVQAAAHLPDRYGAPLTAVRLEGFGPSVAARVAMIEALWSDHGGAVRRLPEPAAEAFWSDTQRLAGLADGRSLWRINTPPSGGPRIVDALEPLGARWLFDWAGGLTWLTFEGSADTVRQAAAAAGGHAMLLRADAATRRAVPAFHPQPGGVATLEARVRAAFDPSGVFETHRFLDAADETSFSPAQLADPDTAASEGVIRKCVHCGFCTATCPTYVLLGDERDSPRGRIYLIKEMLEAQATPTPDVVRHVDRCLSCLACMSTCPSGVNYMHLVDHARAYIERRYRRPPRERLLRGLLVRVLPYPRRFRWALRLVRLARPLAPLGAAVFGPPVRAMLDLAPQRLAPSPPARSSPAAAARGRIVMLQGCAEPVLAPQIRAAAVRLLNRAGYDVAFTAGEGCCGSLAHHLGREEESLAAARRNVDAWTREIETKGVDAIVVTASGCGTTLKDYGWMLRSDPAYADKAARVSALAADISEVLDRVALPPGAGDGLRVAYHPACSLQHGQKVVDAPKALLAAAGFRVRTPAEAHLCCGSAGTYNLLQPVIAGQLRDRKLADIEALAPQVIATGNIGCMVQIASRAQVPVVHTVELLDWATGGPLPPAMAGLDLARSPA